MSRHIIEEKYSITLCESLSLTLSSTKPVFLCSNKGVRFNKSKLTNLYIFHLLHFFLLLFFFVLHQQNMLEQQTRISSCSSKFNLISASSFLSQEAGKNRPSMKKLHLFAAWLQHEIFFMNKYLFHDTF